MKKRFVAMFLCCLMLVSGGCGKDYGSQKGQDCAKQAIETITSYCDGIITYDMAKNTLDKLSADMDYASDAADREKNPNHAADFSIQASITIAGSDLLHDKINSDADSYEKLQKDIDNLRKYIQE